MTDLPIKTGAKWPHIVDATGYFGKHHTTIMWLIQDSAPRCNNERFMTRYWSDEHGNWFIGFSEEVDAVNAARVLALL